MDRQTLRDWVHRFNASGLEGLKDAWWSGPAPRLSPAQKTELAEIVETGPDPAVDGVVRWRRVDRQKERCHNDAAHPDLTNVTATAGRLTMEGASNPTCPQQQA